jgi:hypothetical protein
MSAIEVMKPKVHLVRLSHRLHRANLCAGADNLHQTFWCGEAAPSGAWKSRRCGFTYEKMKQVKNKQLRLLQLRLRPRSRQPEPSKGAQTNRTASSHQLSRRTSLTNGIVTPRWKQFGPREIHPRAHKSRPKFLRDTGHKTERSSLALAPGELDRTIYGGDGGICTPRQKVPCRRTA